jgi:hypothetical protein
VVGGKAAARSLFVLSTYLISVLTCIVSDVAILAVWWMNPATPPADLLTPAAMLFA